MKNIMRSILFALGVLILVPSCDYRKDLEDLNNEVHRLQALVKDVNESTMTLLSLIAASQSDDDWVTSVEKVFDDGKDIGTRINFLYRESIFIPNGKDGAKGDRGDDGSDGMDAGVPSIGVSQGSDGIWYWTVNGSPLLNEKGEKVIARGADGTAPMVKAESGKWWVSHDCGLTWIEAGTVVGTDWSPASNYSDVTVIDGVCCEVTLNNGQKLYLPLWVDFSISLPYGTVYYLLPGSEISVSVYVSPYTDVDISAVCDGGLSVGECEVSELSGIARIPVKAGGGFSGGTVRLVFGKGGKLVYKQLIFKPLDYSDGTVKEVVISKTSKTLAMGCNHVLTAYVIPESATYSNIIWSSSNPAVATVNGYGLVSAISAGSCRITAMSHNGKTAVCNVTVSKFRAVDLGLSVDWAEMNIGAASAFELGSCFAWGETKDKTGTESPGYNWNSYSLCGGTPKSLLRYNSKAAYGVVDNCAVLSSSDDAASVNWGDEWRSPTAEEWAELYDCCTWEWLESGASSSKVASFTANVSGYLVIKGGVGPYLLDPEYYIFLPSGGYISGSYREDILRCHYWTGTLYVDFPDNALEFVADPSSIKPQYGSSRCYGMPIRPIIPKI